MNWVSVVSLIGAAQGCFIAYLVLAHARQRRANLWLGLFVVAYAALCLGDALGNSGLVPRYPDVTSLFDFCIFLLGTLLYQYVRTLTGRRSLGALLWVHVIPAELLLLLQVVFHLLPMDEKRRLLAADAALKGGADWLKLTAALQILAYLVAGLLRLREYAKGLKQNYSAIEKLSFVWLRNLLLINGLLWLGWSAGMFTRSRVQMAMEYIGFPVAAYVLAAFALRAPQVLVTPDESPASPAPDTSPVSRSPEAQPEIAETLELKASASKEERDEAARSEGRKYQKSQVPSAILDRYQRKLEALMSQQKAYLESELTLPQLAARLGAPNHHLSQLLNERLGITFFDYVNRLRVEEVKRLLRDPKRASQSILELAFEAGFSSKSSFNSIFKRSTGKSPSASAS